MKSEVLLKNINIIVASEIHGLSTWDGTIKKFYIKTDINPNKISFDKIKEHITEIQENYFKGSFWIKAFTNDTKRI